MLNFQIVQRRLLNTFSIRCTACIIMLILNFGCTRFSTLNMQEHRYGVVPIQIVWIQIAGLELQHLAMLRFSTPTVFDKTSFESARCTGETWRYNLYELRPDAFSSLMTQITGKKNIKGGESCSDFNYAPIWKYLHENGYDAAVLESGVDSSTSLDKALRCGGPGRNFLNDIILWKMARLKHLIVNIKSGANATSGTDKGQDNKHSSLSTSESKSNSRLKKLNAHHSHHHLEVYAESDEDEGISANSNNGSVQNNIYKNELFHVQEKNSFRSGHIYYDKSCQQQLGNEKNGMSPNECYTGLARNVEYLFNDFVKDRDRIFFLIRDFSYLNALKRHDIESAREILMEIEKVHQNLLSYLSRPETKGKMLLLITSAAPYSFEFPDSGKEWVQFEKSGDAVFYRKSSLMSPVLAIGARAENFCGIYEEAEIFKRIVEGPHGMQYRHW